jgi:hypothetical protein
VSVIGYVPPEAGVPDKTPVVAFNVTPLGRAPVALQTGAGNPVAAAVNAPAAPTANVALLALVIAGGALTESVKLWLAFGNTPFCAVIVTAYVPPDVGVPERTPVAGLNVTPAGSVPLSVNVGVGTPIAVTVNDPAVADVNVALFPLVIAGAELTVSVKLWLALGRIPFCAEIVMGYVPPVVGVPDRIPVAELKVTPGGSVPVSLRIGTGVPAAVTANVPAVPDANVALLALVITGGESTVSVKL